MSEHAEHPESGTEASVAWQVMNTAQIKDIMSQPSYESEMALLRITKDACRLRPWIDVADDRDTIRAHIQAQAAEIERLRAELTEQIYRE